MSFILPGIIGAVLGSFLITWIQGNSLWQRSRCNSCGIQISYYDLIPIFSYIFLKGRCRSCSILIPKKLWFAEIFGSLVGLLIGFLYPQDWLVILISTSLLIAASIDDWRSLSISPMPILGLLLLTPWAPLTNFQDSLIVAGIAASLLYFTYLLCYFWLKLRPCGFIDLFTFIAAIAWFPLDYLPYFFLLAGLSSLLIHYLISRKQQPFIPAIAYAWALLHLSPLAAMIFRALK